MNKIVGIIPARMASTRFPGKPLAKIQGIPMIGHVYHRSKMCGSVNEVCIATCDKEIADYASSVGCKAIMTADTHERASDRAAEAMLKLEENTGNKVDIVVMIQGDEPMIYPEMISGVIRPLSDDSTLKVANLIAPVRSQKEHEDPNTVKVVTDKDDSALYFSREPIPSRKKWTKDIPMFKQLGIIAFRRDMLIRFSELMPTPLEIIESVDMLRLLEHGYKVRMVPTPFEIYGVDTPADLTRVDALMADDRLFQKYRKTP